MKIIDVPITILELASMAEAGFGLRERIVGVVYSLVLP